MANYVEVEKYFPEVYLEPGLGSQNVNNGNNDPEQVIPNEIPSTLISNIEFDKMMENFDLDIVLNFAYTSEENAGTDTLPTIPTTTGRAEQVPIGPPQVLSQELNHTKRDPNIKKKNQNTKGRRKKKEDSTIINKKVKPKEQENCIDVKTIPDTVPALEASDLNTLLEKFEASENSDKIKTSGRKRPISIPPMPNIQSGNNNIRMQDGAPPSKILKTSSTETNNVKTTFSSALVHKFDHDYCKNANIDTSQQELSNERRSSNKTMSVLKSNQNKNYSKFEEHHNNVNLNKRYNLKSANVCDNGKPAALQNKQADKIKDNALENNNKNCQKETLFKQPNGLIKVSPTNVPNIPIYPKVTMEIRSGLAKKILRKDMLAKMNIAQTNPKTQSMISILQNPPNVSQSLFSTNNSNENIATTTNSLNNEVQNITIQNTQDTLPHEEVKTNPPRRKLNLAEYRSRRHQNYSDNSKTNSPMVLMDVHHAFTTTEPIKDDPKNPIWCERVIIPVLKAKSNTKEETNKSKPPTCDIGIQTYETVFEFSTKSSVDVIKKNEKSKESTKNKKQNRRRSLSRSLSRSRSKSRSRSRGRKRNRSSSKSKSRSQSKSRTRRRSRTRNINTSYRGRTRSRSKSRSRSRSCRRSNTRRRTISHRRSVSSTSSWSSRSRYSYSLSDSRSTSRSRIRSGSRSRSRSFDRYRRQPFNHNYRNRRSPLRPCAKPYWCREEQREVEERRVMYVGRINESVSKTDLRKRFEICGTITDISIHFRERGDNYGFITFKNNQDTYNAIEHGNDDPSLPRYDLCFGGRRKFCKSTYADLDDIRDNAPIGRLSQANEENSFDFLLKEATAKLRKRKV